MIRAITPRHSLPAPLLFPAALLFRPGRAGCVCSRRTWLCASFLFVSASRATIVGRAKRRCYSGRFDFQLVLSRAAARTLETSSPGTGLRRLKGGRTQLRRHYPVWAHSLELLSRLPRPPLPSLPGGGTRQRQKAPKPELVCKAVRVGLMRGPFCSALVGARFEPRLTALMRASSWH